MPDKLWMIAAVLDSANRNPTVIYMQEVSADGLMDSQFLLCVGAAAERKGIPFDEIQIGRLELVDFNSIPFKLINN